jgi:PAS domain-containing protein
MNQSLTRVLITRAAAAEKRLMTLTQQQERGERPSGHLSKTALRELGEALEELRVATEHLQLAADDLAVSRREATASADSYRELYEGLPMPCILTNEQGTVDEANMHASKLLNVAAPYLTGKPLLLYLPQRDTYFRLLEQVSIDGTARAQAMLRPRDRKPVEVNVTVTALKRQVRWCWVFWERAHEAESRVPPIAGALLSTDPAGT